MAETRLVLEFDRALYHPSGVQAAVEAYEDYTESITVDASEASLTVTLVGFDEGYGEVFGDEFANHALFESVVRTRQTLAGVPV